METSAEEDLEGEMVEGEMGSEDMEGDMDDFPEEWMVLDDADEENLADVDSQQVETKSPAAGDSVRSGIDEGDQGLLSSAFKETAATPSADVPAEPPKTAAKQDHSGTKSTDKPSQFPAQVSKASQPSKQAPQRKTQTVTAAATKKTGVSNSQPEGKGPAKQSQAQAKKSQSTTAVSSKQAQHGSGLSTSKSGMSAGEKTGKTAALQASKPVAGRGKQPGTPAQTKAASQVKTGTSASKTAPKVVSSSSAPNQANTNAQTKPATPKASPQSGKKPQVQAKGAVGQGKPSAQAKTSPKPAAQSRSSASTADQAKTEKQATSATKPKTAAQARPAQSASATQMTAAQGEANSGVKANVDVANTVAKSEPATSETLVNSHAEAQAEPAKQPKSDDINTSSVAMPAESELPAAVEEKAQEKENKQELSEIEKTVLIDKKLASDAIVKVERLSGEESKAELVPEDETSVQKDADKDKETNTLDSNKTENGEGNTTEVDGKVQPSSKGPANDETASKPHDKQTEAVRSATEEEDKSKSASAGKADVKSGERSGDKPSDKSPGRSKDTSRTRSPGRDRDKGRNNDRSQRSSDKSRSRSDYSPRYRRDSRDRDYSRSGDRRSDSKKYDDKRSSSASASKSSSSGKNRTPVKGAASGDRHTADKKNTSQDTPKSEEKKKSAQLVERGMQTDAVKLDGTMQKTNEKDKKPVKDLSPKLSKAEIRKLDDEQVEKLLETKSNAMENGLWRFAVRLSPVELGDLAQESLRKLLNGAQDCAVFLKNQGTGKKKKGDAKMYFSRMQLTKYAMQKLFQTPLTCKRIDVEISRKLLGSSDKDTVMLDLDLTSCVLLTQAGSAAGGKDASGAADDKNVHISNVPKSTTQELLFVIFPTALTIQMPKEGHDKGSVVVQFPSGEYAQDVMRCYVSVTINRIKLRLTWKGLSRDKIPAPKASQKVDMPKGKAAQAKQGFAGKAANAAKTEDAVHQQTIFQIPVRDTLRVEKVDAHTRGSRELLEVVNDQQPPDAKRPRLESSPFLNTSNDASTYPSSGLYNPGEGPTLGMDSQGDVGQVRPGGNVPASFGDTRSVEIVSGQEMQGMRFEGQIVQGTEAISDDEDLQGMEAISPEWDEDSPGRQNRAKDVQRSSRNVQRALLNSRQKDGNSNTFDRTSSGRYENSSRADRDHSWSDRFKGQSERETGSFSKGGQSRPMERPRSLDRQVSSLSSRPLSASPGRTAERFPVHSGDLSAQKHRSRSPVRPSGGRRHSSISPSRSSRYRQSSRSPSRQYGQRRPSSQSPPGRRRGDYSPVRQRQRQELSPVSDHSLGGHDSSPTKQRRSPGRLTRRSYSPGRRGHSPGRRKGSPARQSYGSSAQGHSFARHVEILGRQTHSSSQNRSSVGQSPPRHGSLTRRDGSPKRRGRSPLSYSRSPSGHSQSTRHGQSPRRKSHSPGRRYSPDRRGRSPGRRSPYRRSPGRVSRSPSRTSDYFQARAGMRRDSPQRSTGSFDRGRLNMMSMSSTLAACTLAMPLSYSQGVSSISSTTQGLFAGSVTSAPSTYTSVKPEPVIPGLDLLTSTTTSSTRSVLDIMRERNWAQTGSREESFRSQQTLDSSKIFSRDSLPGRQQLGVGGDDRGGSQLSRDSWMGKQEDLMGFWGTEKPQNRSQMETSGSRDQSASSREGPGPGLDLMSLRKEAAKHLASLEKNVQPLDTKRIESSVGMTRTTGSAPSTSFSVDYGHQQRAPDNRSSTSNMGDVRSGMDRMNWGESRKPQQQQQQQQQHQQQANNSWSTQINQKSGPGWDKGGTGSHFQGMQGMVQAPTSHSQTGNQGAGFGMMSAGRSLQSGQPVRPAWETDISQQRGVMGPAPSQMGFGVGGQGGAWQGGGAMGMGMPRPQGPGFQGPNMPAPGMPGTGMPGAGMSGAGMSGVGMTGAGLSSAGMSGTGMSGSSMMGPGTMAGPGMAGPGMSGPGMSGPGMGAPGMPGPNDSWLPPPPRPPLHFSGANPFMRPPF